MRSDLQCLYQVTFVSRQFTESQAIRIMVMWLQTIIDNRIQARFPKRQQEGALRVERIEWRRDQDVIDRT